MKKSTLTMSVLFMVCSSFMTKAHAVEKKYQDLTPDEKQIVYDTLKMDDTGFLAENFIPFGAASFARGDYLTGSVVCALDLATLAVVAMGNGWTIGYAPIGYAVGRGVGLFTLWNHIPEHNQQLKYDLGLQQSLEMGAMGSRPGNTLGPAQIQLANYQITF